MRRNPPLLCLLMLVLCAGCASYPKFTHPIVKPEEAERFEELLGSFRSKDPDTGKIAWLHIGFCDSDLPVGFHKIVAVVPGDEDQGLSVGQYIGFVFKHADSYIVQLPRTEDSGDNQAQAVAREWGKSSIDGYLLFRIKRTEKQLRIGLLDEERVEELINRGVLSGRIEQEVDRTTEPPTTKPKTITVTSDTGALKTFFESNSHDKLFKTHWTFERVTASF